MDEEIGTVGVCAQDNGRWQVVRQRRAGMQGRGHDQDRGKA